MRVGARSPRALGRRPRCARVHSVASLGLQALPSFDIDVILLTSFFIPTFVIGGNSAFGIRHSALTECLKQARWPMPCPSRLIRRVSQVLVAPSAASFRTTA